MQYTDYTTRKARGLTTFVMQAGAPVLSYQGFDDLTGEKVTREQQVIDDAIQSFIETQKQNLLDNIQALQVQYDALTALSTDLAALTTKPVTP